MPRKGFVSYSKFLETIYAHGMSGYDGTKSERRIKFLYEHLKDMKPWEWDFENYGEDNKDMIGFFYPEDVENIKQLEYYEMQYAERQAKRK